MDIHLANLDWSGLEILRDEECLRLLDAAPIGRLGFVDQGSPVILPVNFAVEGRSIAFRTAAGSKLSTALLERPVCLEVDGWDAVARSGWSVLAKGYAMHHDDGGRTEASVRPWSRPELREHWVSIMVEELSGRRIS